MSKNYDHLILGDHLWVTNSPVGVPIYDFPFRDYLECKTPFYPRPDLPAVARIGAFEDYPAFFSECAAEGIQLIHTPEQHLRCTSLPIWYPLIESYTPRSVWYPHLPTFAEVEEQFTLPVFIKGSRQTSKHQAAASIIHTQQDFEIALSIFRSDPILRWQTFVCRELIPLRAVTGGTQGKVPASFEFRTFWWRGQLVGAGRYWYDADEYQWTPLERDHALSIAQAAANALDCTFVVIDLAQTIKGKWIVIECNDGMESGYAGVSPFALWQNILDIERQRLED